MDKHNTSNAEYAACHDRYYELADQMRPYAFYSHVTSEGLSRYFASCLLRRLLWNGFDPMQTDH